VAMSFRLPCEKPAPEYTEMKVSQAGNARFTRVFAAFHSKNP